MRFYRLHKMHQNGESAGFEYFTVRREADKAFTEWMHGEEEWVCGCEGTKIEIIEFMPTKIGILKALKRYASHPDNG